MSSSKSLKEREDALRAKFAKYEQSQVFAHLHATTDDAEREAFLKQLEEVPLDEIKALVSLVRKRHLLTESQDHFVPWTEVHSGEGERAASLRERGLELTREGKVAAILMAGGQGTRLGSKDPKGMYNVGLLSEKSLYQLQAERLLRLRALASTAEQEAPAIPWYIMTSEATMEKTRAFFQTNGYFGLPEDSVTFFTQAKFPTLNSEGKLMLAEPLNLSRSPNGNGGIYKAMQDAGLLEDFDARGLEYFFVYGVDNVAVKICDPTFVGLLNAEGGDVGVKVVEKDHPNERVGVLAKRNGHPSVVEYSEIDPHVSAKVGPDGKLLYNEGNICIHLFTRAFLGRACKHYKKLQKHVAHKAIPYVDAEGTQHRPDSPNGFKFEMFVFDVFSLSHRLVCMAVERAAEFLPLKNKPGTGNSDPESCKAGLEALHKRYLQEAGATTEGDAFEISPLVSYDGEGLKELVAGKTLKAPFHLSQSTSKL